MIRLLKKFLLFLCEQPDFFSYSEKCLTFIFKQKRVPDGCFKRSRNSLLQRNWETTRTRVWRSRSIHWENAIPFLENYIVPAARPISADMLGFAVREIADFVSGKQKFKAAAKIVGRQTLKENNSGGGRRKRSASKVIQPKSKKWNFR